MTVSTFVLDTSAYSAFNRKDLRIRPWFRADKSILIPLVVVAELRAGFANGNQTKQNELLLQRFLDAPNVTTIGLTDATTKAYAELFISLRRAGTPIGTNDMWIAAMTLEHNSVLLTLDSDFNQVPNLSLAKV